jgi:hypothetical protein
MHYASECVRLENHRQSRRPDFLDAVLGNAVSHCKPSWISSKAEWVNDTVVEADAASGALGPRA